MKVRLLRCATMCLLGPRVPASFVPRELTCNCLLIETDSGLVLVDTGVGLEDLADTARLGPMRFLLGLKRDPAETALRRVEDLGYQAEDVRHVVVTHLDLDHAGGLPDFPHATVHALAAEQAAALEPDRFRRRERYRPCHFAHGPDWRTYAPSGGETWKGFTRVRALDGLPPEILLIPLPGHTPGHAGVAVESENGWLLHAGDAYYDARQVGDPPAVTPGMRLFQVLAHDDRARAAETLARLRRLRAGEPGLRLLCAHDAGERLEG